MPTPLRNNGALGTCSQGRRARVKNTIRVQLALLALTGMCWCCTAVHASPATAAAPPAQGKPAAAAAAAAGDCSVPGFTFRPRQVPSTATQGDNLVQLFSVPYRPDPKHRDVKVGVPHTPLPSVAATAAACLADDSCGMFTSDGYIVGAYRTGADPRGGSSGSGSKEAASEADIITWQPMYVCKERSCCGTWVAEGLVASLLQPVAPAAAAAGKDPKQPTSIPLNDLPKDAISQYFLRRELLTTACVGRPLPPSKLLSGPPSPPGTPGCPSRCLTACCKQLAAGDGKMGPHHLSQCSGSVCEGCGFFRSAMAGSASGNILMRQYVRQQSLQGSGGSPPPPPAAAAAGAGAGVLSERASPGSGSARGLQQQQQQQQGEQQGEQQGTQPAGADPATLAASSPSIRKRPQPRSSAAAAVLQRRYTTAQFLNRNSTAAAATARGLLQWQHDIQQGSQSPSGLSSGRVFVAQLQAAVQHLLHRCNAGLRVARSLLNTGNSQGADPPGLPRLASPAANSLARRYTTDKSANETATMGRGLMGVAAATLHVPQAVTLFTRTLTQARGNATSAVAAANPSSSASSNGSSSTSSSDSSSGSLGVSAAPRPAVPSNATTVTGRNAVGGGPGRSLPRPSAGAPSTTALARPYVVAKSVNNTPVTKAAASPASALARPYQAATSGSPPGVRTSSGAASQAGGLE